MQEIDTMYREVILDLYRNPINKKVLFDFDVEHNELNPSCGDEISVQIKFDEGGRVVDIGYQGQGCAISEAAMSLLTDSIKGKYKDEILKLVEEDISALLGFSVVYTRKKCATLGLSAVIHALS